MNSHIQLPNNILEQFRDTTTDEKQVPFIDLHDNFIHSKSSKKLGTAKDYYSKEMEKWLNANIESPASNLFARVRQFCLSDSKSVSISQEDEMTFKIFVKNMLARSNLAGNSYSKHDSSPFPLSKQNKNDGLVSITMQIHGSIDSILSEMKMVILINRSSCNFVVPRNAIYTAAYGDSYRLIAPIHPAIALTLIPNRYFNDFNHEGIFYCDEILDPRQIHHLNVEALKCEYAFNKEFVASCRKQELVDLLPYLNNNYDEL